MGSSATTVKTQILNTGPLKIVNKKEYSGLNYLKAENVNSLFN